MRIKHKLQIYICNKLLLKVKNFSKVSVVGVIQATAQLALSSVVDSVEGILHLPRSCVFSGIVALCLNQSVKYKVYFFSIFLGIKVV